AMLRWRGLCPVRFCLVQGLPLPSRRRATRRRCGQQIPDMPQRNDNPNGTGEVKVTVRTAPRQPIFMPAATLATSPIVAAAVMGPRNSAFLARREGEERTHHGNRADPGANG